MRTYMANTAKIDRKWYVIDASDVSLGRLSTAVASILRGKNKPTFTPHVDTGDYVIVINAEKVKLTGKKETDKLYSRHSGYPSGLTQVSAGDMRENRPDRLIGLSVKGMLPKNPLGRKTFKKLFVYEGPEHKQSAQSPEMLDIEDLI